MKHVKKICKTALVAWVSLCLVGLIASSCRTVHKSVSQENMVLVTGTVLDDNNEPLIGASIIQQGNSKNSAISDIDGHFTINVPAVAFLIVKYVGYYDNAIEAKDGMTVILNHDPNYKETELIVL